MDEKGWDEIWTTEQKGQHLHNGLCPESVYFLYSILLIIALVIVNFILWLLFLPNPITHIK